ncbi:MAG: D-glycero-beta-D-manno-heptose 1-phosphate adenylyltransferase [Elusimicrobia bacterium]|nr:D-glycero-beta-D-manno-heptose 1-phosphate adenylyltransferase [Elusimicrobiota bacterium]
MNSKNKIISASRSFSISQRAKKKGLKVVFTNGCFDIIHAGHVKSLEKARSFGDILIVGLNSDLSVKKLKGKNRPINKFLDRAAVLAAFYCVDYVVGFSEDTPYRLIKGIKPDILVKGGDYNPKEVVGAEFSGKVKIIPLLKGRSTTKIIEKSRHK